MGFGFDLGGIVDWASDFIGIGGSTSVGGGGGAATVDQIRSGDYNQVINEVWSRTLASDQIDIVRPYGGPGYHPLRIGWPVSIGIESLGTASVLPGGTFFIGHAVEGMIMQALSMTQTNMPPSLDYSIQAGFSARLVQRDPGGQIRFVSGFEQGVLDDGTVVREDLRLTARDPRTALVSYGGPIEAYWPLYIVLQTYGDFGPVTGLADVQVQVNATFLCPEVAKTESGESPARPDRPSETPGQRSRRMGFDPQAGKRSLRNMEGY
jgi:hypothetical protein